MNKNHPETQIETEAGLVLAEAVVSPALNCNKITIYVLITDNSCKEGPIIRYMLFIKGIILIFLQ